MQSEYLPTEIFERLKAGDEAARNEIVSYAYERLRRHSHRMLRAYPVLAGLAETEDVLHNAYLDLRQAFDNAGPLESAQHFWNRAFMMIRRSLNALVCHHLGRDRDRQRAAGLDAASLGQILDGADGPQTLSHWAEFHEKIEGLPEAEREVICMRWYGGLSHREAAALIGVSEREVERRWLTARVLLGQSLRGQSPAS
jgi:RNA polymerase sigma-70 factor (ECF subfamily)